MRFHLFPRRLRRPLAAWFRHDGGATAITYAALLIPSVMAVGLAVDGATLYSVHARLQSSTDAAALAMGVAATKGTSSISALQAIGNPYLQKNLGSDSYVSNAAVLGSPDTSLVGKTLTVGSSADVTTSFMAAFGFKTITVSASTEVQTGIGGGQYDGIELILSLDNTGSMLTTPSGESKTNFEALRSASKLLVDVLYGDKAVEPVVKVGIVPWVTAVNAGVTLSDGQVLANKLINTSAMTEKQWYNHTASGSGTNPTRLSTLATPQYIAFDSSANQTATNGDMSSTAQTAYGWAGCVIERSYVSNRDIDDSLPAVGGYWSQYYWIDWDKNNPWRSGTCSSSSNCTKSISRTGTTAYNDRGPNLACPSPLTPLTSTKATLTTAITNLHGWRRGGTVGVPGLSWAYRLLSPDFTLLPSDQRGTSWTNSDILKAVIFMTDGDTNVQNGVYNNGSQSDDDLTAYGFPWENKFGPSSNDTLTEQETWVNTRIGTVCTALKAKGVRIYTIVFTSSISTSTKNVYKNCATDATKFYDAPSQSDLQNAFQAIAFELGSLRITK